jgi:hypothetical protein
MRLYLPIAAIKSWTTRSARFETDPNAPIEDHPDYGCGFAGLLLMK